MKTILIPTEDHDAMPAVLEGARLIAHAFGSYMEGFAVRPSPGDLCHRRAGQQPGHLRRL